MHGIERREHEARDVRHLVEIALVLGDRVHLRLHAAVRREKSDAGLLDVDGVVADAVLIVLYGRGHLERELVDAVHHRDAVRDDGVHAVVVLVDVEVHVFREVVDDEIALVAEVVRARARRLGRHDILVELDELIRVVVDLRDAEAHVLILGVDLLLQLLRRCLDAVGEHVALLDDGRAVARGRGARREIVPRIVELGDGVLNARVARVVEDGLDLVVVRLLRLIVLLLRRLRPVLLVRVDIACTLDRGRVDARADHDLPIDGRDLLAARGGEVDALARIALRPGVRDVVPCRIEGELVRVDAPHHRVEPCECGTHIDHLFLAVLFRQIDVRESLPHRSDVRVEHLAAAQELRGLAARLRVSVARDGLVHDVHMEVRERLALREQRLCTRELAPQRALL